MSSSQDPTPDSTPKLSMMDYTPDQTDMDLASLSWMSVTVIEDDDLMFGGKPLCAWYEEDRRRLSSCIDAELEDEEENRGRQRERVPVVDHNHHRHGHHGHQPHNINMNMKLHHAHQHHHQHHRHHHQQQHPYQQQQHRHHSKNMKASPAKE